MIIERHCIFSKKLFLEKSIFWRVPKFNHFEFGIWSTAQTRNPNLSYASKRDCASIAPHTNLKKVIAQHIANPFVRASGRDETQAAECVLFFGAAKKHFKKFRGQSFFPPGGTKKGFAIFGQSFFIELGMRRYTCAIAFGRIAQIRIPLLSYRSDSQIRIR